MYNCTSIELRPSGWYLWTKSVEVVAVRPDSCCFHHCRFLEASKEMPARFWNCSVACCSRSFGGDVICIKRREVFSFKRRRALYELNRFLISRVLIHIDNWPLGVIMAADSNKAIGKQYLFNYSCYVHKCDRKRYRKIVHVLILSWLHAVNKMFTACKMLKDLLIQSTFTLSFQAHTDPSNIRKCQMSVLLAAYNSLLIKQT